MYNFTRHLHRSIYRLEISPGLVCLCRKERSRDRFLHLQLQLL